MRNSVTNWLLEDNNPAIKYRTLVDICGTKDTVELKVL